MFFFQKHKGACQSKVWGSSMQQIMKNRAWVERNIDTLTRSLRAHFLFGRKKLIIITIEALFWCATLNNLSGLTAQDRTEIRRKAAGYKFVTFHILCPPVCYLTNSNLIFVITWVKHSVCNWLACFSLFFMFIIYTCIS